MGKCEGDPVSLGGVDLPCGEDEVVIDGETPAALWVEVFDFETFAARARSEGVAEFLACEGADAALLPVEGDPASARSDAGVRLAGFCESGLPVGAPFRLFLEDVFFLFGVPRGIADDLDDAVIGSRAAFGEAVTAFSEDPAEQTAAWQSGDPARGRRGFSGGPVGLVEGGVWPGELFDLREAAEFESRAALPEVVFAFGEATVDCLRMEIRRGGTLPKSGSEGE